MPYGSGVRQLLSAKEFADLCDITKSTLRFYRDENVIRPETVEENGYGKYAPIQGLDVVRVKTLESCGLPLSRIKTMQSGRDSRELFPYEDVMSRMAKEQRTLAARIAMLGESRRVAEGAAQPCEAFASERPSPKHFLFLEYQRPSADIEYNFVHSMKMLFRLSREYLGTSPYLFGRLVRREDLASGRFNKVMGLVVPISAGLAASGEIPEEHLYREDAGLTLCARFPGRPYAYREPYEKLLSAVNGRGLAVSGNGLELWTGNLCLSERDDYATLIEIPVSGQ